ncbi:MAG TPA: LLM class flavin-dependent oxidoreductase [Stellaceae bacterium]|nr:LLM class flavin-dependent oxidoreductase [Stellaceae bacterium]
MRFGVFYELQLPRPWAKDDELRLIANALNQVELADRIGVDYAWAAEHHFLDEYSHSSASDLFLAAAAARTKTIKLGLGIRQVIANYNHPARTAEAVAMLDLISGGRAQFGIGEGATRLELQAFEIPAKEKRAMSLEAAEQIANMMVMEPYPGYEGRSFRMPCRNVLPKPWQKPHPPMWMACTNRDTIKVAARHGLGVLAFNFLDADEASTWSTIYYDIIRSEECVPLGHAVNANIAMMTAFSLHPDRAEAVRRGQENFEFFAYAMNSLIREEVVPGRTDIWGKYLVERGDATALQIYAAQNPQEQGLRHAVGIGTPQEFLTHVQSLEACGVDQVIFLQQAGRMKHEHITDSLELFGRDVRPAFADQAEEREARKASELAPFIEGAMARKQKMRPLEDHEIPVVAPSKPKAAALSAEKPDGILTPAHA